MVMTTNSPSSSPSADDTLPTTTVYKSDDKHVINDDDNSSSSDSGKRKDPEGRGTIDVYDSFVNGYNNDDGHVTRGVANDDDDDDERLEEIDNNNNNDNNNNSDAHDVESTTSEGAPSVASLSSSYSLKSLPEQQQQQQHQQQDQESLERQRQVPAYVRHMEEDVTSDRWKRRSKHIFILSDAGKPIFTRYGNENDLNTKMSFFQVIVNFVAAGHDTIRTIIAGARKFVFVVKGSLIFVAVATTDESPSELALQLNYLYAQIVFILTDNIQTVLKRSAHFDLRNLLGGTDGVLYSLIHQMSGGLSFSLKSVRCLRMPKQLRSQVGDIILRNRVPKLMFSLLVSGNQLVHMAHNKNYKLRMEDLLLIMNFVNSSTSMKSSETWTPICLPGLSSSSYLYAYIDFLAIDLCMVMICASQEQFFECSNAKKNILHQLIESKLLNAILASMKAPGYSVADIRVPALHSTAQSSSISKRWSLSNSPPLPPPSSSPSSPLPSSSLLPPKSSMAFFLTSTELRHFAYRLCPISQFTTASFSPPYNSFSERKRLCRVYKNVRRRLMDSKSTQKTYFHITNKEAILGWINSNNSIELYAAFTITTSKSAAINAVEAIKKYIKREEDSLFIKEFKEF